MSGPRFRPTWVEVDLDRIRHNVRALTPPGVELMAVVKADAYGHGDVPVTRAALEAGASWLGVALVEEGLRLRLAGIEAPILVLSEAPEGSEAILLAHRLTPSLYSQRGLRRLAAAARGPVAVHVKIDTGMHRVGLWPAEAAPAFLHEVRDAGFEVEGLWTHLAKSEDDEVTTKMQLNRLDGVVESARAAGIEPRYVHAANSGGLLRHPEAHLDLVRPGIAIYGIPPAPGVGEGFDLRPALTWRSTVGHAKRLAVGERVSYGLSYELERPSWIATVPVGYADGYPRSTTGEVLIRGGRCRVAGTVTMDQLIVDCGDLEVAPGDEVVLVGRQDEEEVSAWELAANTATVAYEIVARIGARVPREYRG